MSATPSAVLGLVFPYQGRAAWVSRASVQGIELALALARRDGVPWASRLRLAASDASTPEQARREARRLIEREGAQMLMGSAVSAICLAASEVAEKRMIPYWEAAAVADEVTTRGYRTMFRLNANASDFAREAVRSVRRWLAPALGSVERVAVIHESSPFGTSVGRAVTTAARDGGLAVTAVEPFEPGAAASGALGSILERVGATGSDLLLATAGAREAAAMVRARASTLHSVRAIVGVGGGWASPELSTDLGPELDGVFSVNNARALTLRTEGLRPDARAIWDRYRAASAEAGITDPQADRDLCFIAVDLLLREVLPAASDPSLERFRAAALSLDVPLDGTISGMGLKFDENGHNTRGIVVTMQWQDGTLRTVAPEHLATHDIRAVDAGGGRGGKE